MSAARVKVKKLSEYHENEMQALLSRFKDQAELLYRLTTIDLKIFFSYITLQLVFGAWVSTKDIENNSIRIGLFVIDLVLSIIAIVLLRHNSRRREEAAETIRRCNFALGYEELDVFLKCESLNAPTIFRLWRNWFYVGIVAACIGIFLIIFQNFWTFGMNYSRSHRCSEVVEKHGRPV